MILSFVIVNYHSEKYLEKCISSIKEKVLNVDYEIIVVNNDKNGVETHCNASLQGENIKIINTNKNIGFGAGCNVGAKEARGEILCFLNPDTEIILENIQDILDEFSKDDKLAIVGPRLLNDKNKTQWWCAGKDVTLLGTLLNNLGYKRDKSVWESTIPVECAWVSGAAMFIRADVFKNPPQSPFCKGGGLGGFDEKFFMYFEDIDLCKRARLAGYKILYFSDFIIKHFGGRSFLDKKEQKAYYRKSQRRYFRKYFL